MVPGRFALSGVAAAALCLVLPSAWALGLGRMVVQSSLGEGLRAEIDVSSLTPEEAANLKVRIASPESYRAAGVDYNAVLPSAQVSLQRRSDGRPYLRIVSDKVVQEPFVDVILELNWNTGRLVREYTMLFDPPSTRTQVATPATPAVVAAAPAPAPAPSAPAPAEPRAAAATPPVARAAEPRAAAPKPAAPAPAPSAPAAAPKAAPSAEGYRVQSGDTLSGIAGRVQPQGLSLDQMLVALYRANPQAFVDNNMNRLKSGVVLTVPEADAAKAVSTTEAKQVIQAQSADFAAYRQRLAGAVAPAATEGASRQASGKVQAEVEDRKQASAPTPDKLTLSKGSASAKASAPEAQLSREREAKDAATRTAELQKNVEELKKLTAAAKPASAVGATGAAVAAAAAASTPGLKVTAASPLPAPPTPPASAPVVASAPAASAASTPSVATVAQALASAVPAAASAAPAPKAAAASRPAVAAATPPAAPEGPGLMDTLLEDPMALAGGGLVVALLGGLGVYRYVKRSRRESGETSFLESRLQPDSFFGVSGGQRVDTSEAAAGPASSMSYSLSQLDAIGDVDPVAEADVYLAYGRDLQAEEILKEAIRGNPSRLAIRSKLLEVYAKRRDTKGFELLALQMYSLTQGQGEEWAAAQELGSQIDPDNPLYRPGGRPAQAEGDDGRPFEPLGASTMPQSVLPSPSKFGEVAAAAAAAGAANAADEIDFSLDLDLDLGVPTADEAAPPRMPEITQPMSEMTQPLAPPDATGGDLAFDLPLETPTEVLTVVAPPPPSRDLSLDFDLSGISLDLDAPPVSAPMPLAEVSERPYGDAGGASDGGDDDVDPFERKLELAEEFRQIGDMDGARDLLEEVIAQTGGAIQAKARNMLDNLS